MSLLVDKWRPKKLADLQYHSELSERLRSLVRARAVTCVLSRKAEH